MKQPKKLTRKQKGIVSDYKLNPENWMFVEEDMTSLVVINKQSGKKRVLLK